METDDDSQEPVVEPQIQAESAQDEEMKEEEQSRPNEQSNPVSLLSQLQEDDEETESEQEEEIELIDTFVSPPEKLPAESTSQMFLDPEKQRKLDEITKKYESQFVRKETETDYQYAMRVSKLEAKIQQEIYPIFTDLSTPQQEENDRKEMNAFNEFHDSKLAARITEEENRFAEQETPGGPEPEPIKAPPQKKSKRPPKQLAPIAEIIQQAKYRMKHLPTAGSGPQRQISEIYWPKIRNLVDKPSLTDKEEKLIRAKVKDMEDSYSVWLDMR